MRLAKTVDEIITCASLTLLRGTKQSYLLWSVIARNEAILLLLWSVIARNEAILFFTIKVLYYHNFTSSAHKSFHLGFNELINSNFLALLPAFICFSLRIASSICEYFSYHTSLSQLYFAVKLRGKNLVMCCFILCCKSEVTPVYNTVWFLLVII